MASIAGTYLGNTRTVDRTVPSIPQTDPIVSAVMGVKLTEASTTTRASKTITTALTSAGQVVNTGSSSGTGEVIFTWTPTDLVTPTFTAGWTYWYYIDVTTASGQVETVEAGTWPILTGNGNG